MQGIPLNLTPAPDPSSIPAGYCQCGCGQKTKICTQSDPKRGRVKGQPFRYLQGHAPRKRHVEYWFDPEIGYGKCHCGCGRETPIAKSTDAAKGHIAGKPKLYCYGHSGVKRGQPQYVVDPETGCWVWQWSKVPKGYGHLRVDGRMKIAHRHYYEMKHGAIPDSLELDHTCRNPSCVNPDHLEPVTTLENVRRGKVPVITLEIAREIKRMLKSHTRGHVARHFGVTHMIVYSIDIGTTWKDA